MADVACWWIKDYADGWIKFVDQDNAIKYAKETGAIMQWSVGPPTNFRAEKISGLAVIDGKICPYDN